MKKIILIIALTFLIVQMVVLAVDIDIGTEATARASSGTTGTFIVKENPANDTGKITEVKIVSMAFALADTEVATFFNVGGDNFTTRDTHYIGYVPGGSIQTFEVDLNVQIGDYIGIYYTSAGGIAIDYVGVGIWIYLGDGIPSTNRTFVWFPDATISLEGTGTTVGWPHLWNTITIGKWNTKEIMKWNGLE